MATLRPGSLAYFDTFTGLVPCRVDRIEGPDLFNGAPSSEQIAHFTLTANRGAYKRGEKLHAWVLHVVPRDAVRGQRIIGYRVGA
jgi:hypothetical protein